jgi:hypothetical protein
MSNDGPNESNTWRIKTKKSDIDQEEIDKKTEDLKASL